MATPWAPRPPADVRCRAVAPACAGRPRGRPRGSFTQHRRIDLLRALLRRHPMGLTLYELAQRLEVEPRSVRRYLREIRRKLDLEAEPTRPSGAQLWRICAAEVPRRIDVRRSQAYALLAARRLFEPLRGAALFEEIELAMQALEGVARRPGRGPNAGVADARLDRRFFYLPFAPKDYSAAGEALDVVFQAAFELRPLRCLYPSPSDGAPERIAIHPYALLLYKDALHCLGLDVGRGAVRSFLIEHMRDAACEPKRHFALPASFRVEDFCQGQFGIWRGGDPVQVVVDLDARVAGHVESRQVHPSERREPLPDGGLRLRFTIGDLSEVTSWVLGFGAMARVVSPPELRARVRAELLRAVEQYSPAPAVSAQKANAAGRLPDGVRTLAHDRARRQALPSRPRR